MGDNAAGDSDGYEDVASRFGDYVPKRHRNQQDIRKYIEDEIDLDDRIDKKDKLRDKVSDHISKDRAGAGDGSGSDSGGGDGTAIYDPSGDGWSMDGE